MSKSQVTVCYNFSAGKRLPRNLNIFVPKKKVFFRFRIFISTPFDQNPISSLFSKLAVLFSQMLTNGGRKEEKYHKSIEYYGSRVSTDTIDHSSLPLFKKFLFFVKKKKTTKRFFDHRCAIDTVRCECTD